MKIVYVEWLDSTCAGGQWESKELGDDLTAATCVSAGILLEDTKDYLTLIQTESNDQLMNRISIPKCAITKRKTISV